MEPNFPNVMNPVYHPYFPAPLSTPSRSTLATFSTSPLPTPSVNGDPTHETSQTVNNDYNVYLPSVLIANVPSLSGKVDELSVIANINDIDIICITETWLTDTIPDSTVSLQNFNMFRNDRTSSVGGGVCAYINSKIKVRRIYDFENSSIESLWMSVRPNRLPRSIPVLLLAVIYHSTSRDATENCELYNHTQGNVDLFLLNHPDALVMICGDFNPVSTGFNANRIKQISGLRQIINVATRGESILDWCLINMKHLNFQIIQLPPVGSSDHNSIIVKSHLQEFGNVIYGTNVVFRTVDNQFRLVASF